MVGQYTRVILAFKNKFQHLKKNNTSTQFVPFLQSRLCWAHCLFIYRQGEKSKQNRPMFVPFVDQEIYDMVLYTRGSRESGSNRVLSRACQGHFGLVKLLMAKTFKYVRRTLSRVKFSSAFDYFFFPFFTLNLGGWLEGNVGVVGT